VSYQLWYLTKERGGSWTPPKLDHNSKSTKRPGGGQRAEQQYSKYPYIAPWCNMAVCEVYPIVDKSFLIRHVESS
jgi:hypothetical protein